MSEALTFPPAMQGEAVTRDPAEAAVLRAIQGVDAGLVTWRVAADRVGAALVLAPEVPLSRAMAMLPLCGVGFQNALGALAPPEVAVHLDWDGGLRVNGARCGGMRVFAATRDPAAQPDWLVVSFDLDLLPTQEETGLTPERTALYVEGCADVDPARLVESWARHTLAWIARWEDEGTRPLHAEWRGLAHGIGEDITQDGQSGTFLGVDEHFGMLLRQGAETRLIPLTTRLEDTP
jgi:biotin-(acetyl-CoA carboxylase) ligase